MNDEKIKILIAEDDPFLSKVVDLKFKKEGFEAIMCGDGNEALAQAKAQKPKVVLMDMIMPNKNGFDALVEFKNDPEVKDIPIIILSNLGQEQDVQKGLKAGAVDYIVKSNISINEVVEKVKKYLV